MLKLGREQAQHECRSSSHENQLKLSLPIFKEERGINLLHGPCATQGLIKEFIGMLSVYFSDMPVVLF